mgnify:CR=1 FL=1
MLEVVDVLRREILKRPDDDRCPKDDGTYLLEVVRYALPNMRCGITRLGDTELRQLVYCIIVILLEPLGALHDNCKNNRQADTYRVQRNHHESFVALEEGIDKKHINR